MRSIKYNNCPVALFPISVDSHAFTSASTLPALISIAKKHERIVFFVASELQFYNKVSGANTRGNLSDVFREFDDVNTRYIMERRKWIDRLMQEVKKHRPNIIWSIISMNNYSDLLYLNILRSIRAMHIKIPAFSRDVDITALSHAKGPGIDILSRRRLSTNYILEEIAMGIRIRASYVIAAEYYMGSLPSALLNIYKGVYGIDTSTFSKGLVANRDARFFEIKNTPSGVRWIRV